LSLKGVQLSLFTEDSALKSATPKILPMFSIQGDSPSLFLPHYPTIPQQV